MAVPGPQPRRAAGRNPLKKRCQVSNLGWDELEFEDGQILPHVGLRGRAGQGNRVDLRQIAEQDLRRGALILFGQRRDGAAGQDLWVGGERPKTLIEDMAPAAVGADVAIVLCIRIKPVLDDRGLDACCIVEGLQLQQLVAIADAELPYLPGIRARSKYATTPSLGVAPLDRENVDGHRI